MRNTAFSSLIRLIISAPLNVEARPIARSAESSQPRLSDATRPIWAESLAIRGPALATLTGPRPLVRAS